LWNEPPFLQETPTISRVLKEVPIRAAAAAVEEDGRDGPGVYVWRGLKAGNSSFTLCAEVAARNPSAGSRGAQTQRHREIERQKHDHVMVKDVTGEALGRQAGNVYACVYVHAQVCGK